MTKNSSNTAPIVIALGLIILASLGFFAFNSLRHEEQQPPTDAVRFSREYTLTPQDNRFIYATPEQIISTLESGTGLIFLGFPECPWCQQLAPITNEAAIDESLDQILYLNIRSSRQANDETYQKLVSLLSDYLPKDENGNPRISVPKVIAAKSGQKLVIFEQEATEPGETVTPQTYWTEARHERAVTQLREMIRNIKN